MKLFKIFFSFILLFNFYACSENSKTADNNKSKDSLVFVRETNPVLKTPESVKYDKKNEIFYVSNINGNPSSKDGNGFISKMSADGDITDLKWITGLNAPKGMGIFNDKLYVADIDELVEISISQSKISHKYYAEGANFLNDVDIDKNGNVYISDTGTGKIRCLKNGALNVWYELEKGNKPNGLYCKDDYLYIGTKNNILSVNLNTKNAEIFAENTGNIDGLKFINNEKLIFSDWSGHLYISGKKIDAVMLLNTSKDNIQAADIEYFPNKEMILIPTFYHNTISFYKLSQF